MKTKNVLMIGGLVLICAIALIKNVPDAYYYVLTGGFVSIIMGALMAKQDS